MGIMKNKNRPCLFSSIIMLMWLSGVVVCNIDPCKPVPATDNDIFEFGLNFQHLSAAFFLCGASGTGSDGIDSSLAAGGPPPIGCQRANLDPMLRDIIQEFGYQEIGQIEAFQRLIWGRVPQRPLIDISKGAIAALVEEALGPLTPPFDCYANPINYGLISSFITYNGFVGLVGAAPLLASREHRSMESKLQGIEAGQNAVIRAYLYQRANQMVVPYKITVAEFTNRMSELANRLGKCGLKDEGIKVPRSLGAENRTESNILAADFNSLAYSRTEQELLRIFYGTGNEGAPGAFFPKGANGKIAERFIRKND